MVSLALVVFLGGVRMVEILNGHTPTAELTTAFGTATVAMLGLLAAWHIGNGH